MATISRLAVSLVADPRGFTKGINTAQRAMNGFQNRALALSGVVGAIGGVGVGLLANDLIDVNAKFQKLESSLKTVTGSTQAANSAFALIQEFAKTTPFDLDQVVSAFIKLKARGLDPSERALSAYGNTSSALGKSLDQMIEAVGDATTGQFERLREFNILSSKAGDEITFTYAGVSTTVKNTAQEIEGYLIGLGENKFGTAMSDQMANLGPAFSNLKTEWQLIQKTIGEAGINDLITELATGTTAWLESLDKEQIQGFVHTAINGLADVVEGTQKVIDFLDANPFLTEAGIIGYLLFGKKGIAAVAAGQFFMNQLATTIAGVQEDIMGPGLGFDERIAALNKELGLYEDILSKTTGPAAEFYTEKIANLTAEIQKLSGLQPVLGPSGDFVSSANVNDQAGFAEWARVYREEVQESKKQSTFLEDIANNIRNSTGAVAQ